AQKVGDHRAMAEADDGALPRRWQKSVESVLTICFSVSALLIAVVFDLIAVRVGKIKGIVVAAAVDFDAVLFERHFEFFELRSRHFEADVLQALGSGCTRRALNEVQKIAASRRG